MMPIQSERDARMILPGSADQERDWIAGCIDDRGAPDQNVDFELRPRLDQQAQEIAKRRTVLLFRAQLYAAVKIPTIRIDRLARRSACSRCV